MINLTDKNFKDKITESKKPIIVVATASWSGSSNIIEPIINRNILKYNDIIDFGIIDLQKYLDIGIQYGVVSIPVLLFFQNGKLVDKLDGTFSNSDLENKILKNYLS